jgi:hypothetical protein
MKLSKPNNYDNFWGKPYAFDADGQITHLQFSSRHGPKILTFDRWIELLSRGLKQDPVSLEELAWRGGCTLRTVRRRRLGTWR